MYFLTVSNNLWGICSFPLKTPENNDKILVLAASDSNYHPYFRYYHPVNHPVLWFYWWPIASEDFSQEYQQLDTCPKHEAIAIIFIQKQKLKALFPPNLAWFLLYRISKSTTPKPTCISLTLFADRTRQTPTVRQNAPVRKKLQSTDAMVSWGFHAGSLCCLNALLSGHLEGWASPSLGGKLVLFFIFFLARERNNILVLETVSLRYCLCCWETVLFIQTCIMVRNYLLTRSLFLLFCICAWIPMISLYQSSDCVLWSGCPIHSSWKSLDTFFLLHSSLGIVMSYSFAGILQLYWNFRVISGALFLLPSLPQLPS